MPASRHGRGTFEHRREYLEYKEMIVGHRAYAGMPGAKTSDGRIVWQTSSGKATSFNTHYAARHKWWTAKADSLGLPGRGSSNERYSIAARKIHPTGLRPCLVCGKVKNVGYYYANARLVGRLAKDLGAAIEKETSIDDLLGHLRHILKPAEVKLLLLELFPERKLFFDKVGFSPEAFQRSNYVRSSWLSPGFMCNPPDRLDGFHDYCAPCRPVHDPGRSKDNLRSYNHDRRAFQWWAEGDWFLADALYNSAGPGKCVICDKRTDKVSPDHVGPLACGFKHIPVFLPTCDACNSSKNRRMSLEDVKFLRNYETRTGEIVVGWQVKSLWEANKYLVKSDADAKALSTAMREMQDWYLRILYDLLTAGRARFLRTLLSPEFAFFDVTFEGLDVAQLTFRSYSKVAIARSQRQSLAARSVRIAFEELALYAGKGRLRRKLSSLFLGGWESGAAEIVRLARDGPVTNLDRKWSKAILGKHSREKREVLIAKLLQKHDVPASTIDIELRRELKKLFASSGNRVVVPI
jgi:Alw26I/Eco31I/Esp3I family type II restriction endonuclease